MNNENHINVKVYIKSKISDLVLADMVNNAGENDFVVDEESGENIPVAELASKVDDIIEYMTEGSLDDCEDSISVTYSERKDMGFDNVNTTLSFEKSRPHVVTMVRTGSMSSACRFDSKASRQIISYDTGVMPIQMAISTKSVDNRLTESGGQLFLDYIVEMRGIKTERNLFSMEVRPSL
ncbi:MAG: DUF1934 domain-containing protein [Firmicutes bacterium]|nr:DUF1934 domain-containing protein [Bacillota bacterium]